MIRLRKFRASDASGLCDAVIESRNELIPWMAWCHDAYGDEDARQFVESRAQAWNSQLEFTFVIDDPQGRFLGVCGLNRLDLINRTANLGYWIRTSATRQGNAAQAVRQLADLAFNVTQFNRLELLIAEANVASQRVAQKAGARFEARLAQRLFCQGKFHDAQLYSLLRGEWQATSDYAPR